MKVKIMAKDGSRVVDLNRRKAIRERCLNCSCWASSEVTNCTFTDCTLYLFRTGKGKQNAKERKKCLWKYCLWCMTGQWSEVKKCVSKTCPLFPYRLKRIDKSVEIVSDMKSDYIEAVSGDRNRVKVLCHESFKINEKGHVYE